MGAALASAPPQVVAKVVDPKYSGELGEGSLWDARCGKLLWLDIMGSQLFRYNPVTSEMEQFDLSGTSKSVSSVVPVAGAADKLGVTLKEGFALFNTATSEVERLKSPAVADLERFNDGKVDPAGRYWAGTLTRNAEGGIVEKAASLYCRDLDGSVRKVLGELSISNGLIWTEDQKTMYFIDTLCNRVDALDYNVATGEVSNRRPCVSGFSMETTGLPDGCCLDSEGMLWVARFGGGRVGRYDPSTGTLLAEVLLPKEAGLQVTSVAFGGADLSDLYLTTAHEDMTKEEAVAKGLPLAGCLFRVQRPELENIGIKATGVPAHELQGVP